MCCIPESSWGKALVCALVCTGMAHSPSQLSLEMTKELIPTSAASVGRKLASCCAACALCLPPWGTVSIPACLAAWALWAVLQAVCPTEVPFLVPTSVGSSFHHRLDCLIQGWRQRVQVRPRGQLSSSS